MVLTADVVNSLLYILIEIGHNILPDLPLEGDNVFKANTWVVGFKVNLIFRQVLPNFVTKMPSGKGFHRH